MCRRQTEAVGEAHGGSDCSFGWPNHAVGDTYAFRAWLLSCLTTRMARPFWNRLILTAPGRIPSMRKTPCVARQLDGTTRSPVAWDRVGVRSGPATG